jgi:subtilase family serine protease
VAQRFTDYLYLSPSSVCCAGATTLGGWLAPTLPLASGASYTQTRSVTIPNVAAGAYYFHVWTDLWAGVGEVYEVSDGNNVRTVPVTVGVPDLTPTALTAPTSVSRQQLVNVTWTVRNQGTGAAQRFTDYLYLSPSSVCCTGATNLGGWLAPTLPLAGGASYTQTKSVTIPNVTPGSYYLHVWTDFWGGAGEVYESNDMNNTRSLAVTVQ